MSGSSSPNSRLPGSWPMFEDSSGPKLTHKFPGRGRNSMGRPDASGARPGWSGCAGRGLRGTKPKVSFPLGIPILPSGSEPTSRNHGSCSRYAARRDMGLAARTVLAGKSPLRGATNRRALARSAPFWLGEDATRGSWRANSSISAVFDSSRNPDPLRKESRQRPSQSGTGGCHSTDRGFIRRQPNGRKRRMA